MVKRALLIGVNAYENLPPLSTPIENVKALEQILKKTEIGEFAEIECLFDPDSQQMRIRIEQFFAGCGKADLVLLFFSGHGIPDDQPALYFATKDTQKNLQGRPIRSTTVAARHVQECMISSTCKRQVVILDCCHSGAFSQQNLPMGGSNVDVSGAIKQALDALDPVNPTARFTLPSDRAQNPLGREGRAVLTSSTSLEYSFERLTQNDASKLSVYTRYLIEGLETGVADTDEDGNISAYGLHEYAKRKVKDEFPDMTPQFFAHREGHGILLARSKPKDRRFKYQKAVEDIVRENADKAVEWGRLPDAANSVLLDILEHLNEERLDGPILSLEEATEIQATVLKPLLRLHKKLQRYRNRFVEFLTHEQQYPLKDADRVRLLQTLQGELGLRAVDTNRIEKEAVLHLYHQKLDERLGMLK